MVRVGIYIDSPKPEAGGAASLLGTIREDAAKLLVQDEFDFVFLYKGGKGNPYKTRLGNDSFINVDYVEEKSKWKRKLHKIKYYFKPWKLMDIEFGETESFWDIIGEDEGIDLFWFTSPLIAYTSIPYIFTVWDLGHRVLPQFPEVSRPMSEWYGRETIYQKMLYRASYIITGNETGKKEILENYPIPESKIRIVPFPVSSFCEGEESKPGFELPDDFFFYPAQFWPHKNHACIIKAIRILKDRGINIHFVFCGSDHGNLNHVKELVQKYGVEDNIIFAGFVSYPELKYLYTHARAMVFASLMGPNNIPPIEAIYLGCPVIISNIPGHIEQMGETAVYFDGCVPESLADKLEKLSDEEARKEMIAKGDSFREELKRYSYTENMFEIIKDFSSLCDNWK